ncbi:GatB/YqeY domain-containing protein [Thioalkalivibrio paradoxus]|uniref:Aspartyl-tRNA amidotransferase subunit B n=1 Tax=Thioalkalivibrio paradoxus ARh 1 TaxID=713585 RepID=W0DLN3_9GAMM|nr:GatB/YqeY domain-containing protein [Thioalkalivibrio paradoxus]AHE99356.1 aspartyl-tRNA amidotransferase subunit B [Thioalkalivibrio paradoxus ARh 1]
MQLKTRIAEAVKTAMRARNRERLATLRLIQSEIKQFEVDERREPDDPAVLAILNRMLKQRRDSIEQYRRGAREDLAQREEAETAVLREFLPEPLSPAEVAARIDAAIAATGASGVKDMGRVMAELKPQLLGRADLAEVSRQVQTALAQRGGG